MCAATDCNGFLLCHSLDAIEMSSDGGAVRAGWNEGLWRELSEST